MKHFEYSELNQFECEVNKGFFVKVILLSKDVFLLSMSGILQKKDNFDCSSKLKDFVSRFSKNKIYLIIEFSDLRTVDLDAGKDFFTMIVNWPELAGAYLVGINDQFRLPVKLTTAHDPFLPVFWVDTIENAEIAIKTNFQNQTHAKTLLPVFRLTNNNQRFFELWETYRQIQVINNKKYRSLALPEWFFENEETPFYVKISVIENNIQHLQLIGKITFEDIIALRRIQDRIFAELDTKRFHFYNILDISELKIDTRELLQLFFKNKQPLFIGSSYGIIAPKPFQQSIFKLSKILGRVERKPIRFFNSIGDAFNYIENVDLKEQTPTLLQPNSKQLKKQIEQYEIENEILQNNIQVSREKLFYLISQLNWNIQKNDNSTLNNNILYKDLFDALVLMKTEFTRTWDNHQEKLWLLQTNKEKALRTQLDPHFIFNSLTAIGHLIIEENAELAAEKIDIFSAIMRLIIENSFKTVVGLSSEIEYLSLYAEMEILRFGERFSFELKKTSAINDVMGEMSLPPMLIHPYLEQAISERVLLKPGKTSLSLSFDYHDEILECRIKDYGFSFRQASEKFKNTEPHKERNKRLDILRSRLLLIDEMYGCKIRVFQNEITRTGDQPVISEVIIQIPQYCF